MPESRKAFQAVEWLIDIRGRGVGGSGFLVFDFGQPNGGNGHRAALSHLAFQLASSQKTEERDQG